MKEGRNTCKKVNTTYCEYNRGCSVINITQVWCNRILCILVRRILLSISKIQTLQRTHNEVIDDKRNLSSWVGWGRGFGVITTCRVVFNYITWNEGIDAADDKKRYNQKYFMFVHHLAIVCNHRPFEIFIEKINRDYTLKIICFIRIIFCYV